MSRNTVLELITKAELGGAQMVLLHQVKELRRQGRSVAVAFGRGDYLSKELDKIGVPYFRFKHLKRSLNPISALLFIFEMRKFLRLRNDIGSVHFHSSNTLFGAIPAKALKRKTIFTFHGLSFLDPAHGTALKKFLYRAIFKFLLSFIDERIFVSKANLEYAKKLGLAKDGIVVYNQIEKIDFLNRDQARKELEHKFAIVFGSPTLVSTGRLAYPKNYEFLISVLGQLRDKYPELRCVLIGEGPERKKYAQLSKKLGLTGVLQMPGEIGGVGKYLKAFDLFVLPSLYEGGSIALLEAKQAGLKCLASDVGGNAEIVSRKEIFVSNDEKSFSARFLELLG